MGRGEGRAGEPRRMSSGYQMAGGCGRCSSILLVLHRGCRFWSGLHRGVRARRASMSPGCWGRLLLGVGALGRLSSLRHWKLGGSGFVEVIEIGGCRSTSPGELARGPAVGQIAGGMNATEMHRWDGEQTRKWGQGFQRSRGTLQQYTLPSYPGQWCKLGLWHRQMYFDDKDPGYLADAGTKPSSCQLTRKNCRLHTLLRTPAISEFLRGRGPDVGETQRQHAARRSEMSS